MFTPQSFNIALLMMVTTAFCWGSWANTYKGVKNYRFELFYWDYAVGIFLVSLILGFAYMQWREWRNPGALRRGAMMLIRSGSAGEGEAERHEPAGDDLTLG